jgi:hypothetical protein
MRSGLIDVDAEVRLYKWPGWHAASACATHAGEVEGVIGG